MNELATLPLVPATATAATTSATAGSPTARSAFERAARQVGEDFEGFFLARFIEVMQAGIATDGPFGGGHAEAMFRGLLSDAYAKGVTQSGGVGIADAVYREILKFQEGQQS